MTLDGKLFIILYIAFENMQCIQFTNSSLAEDNLFHETNENLQTVIAQFLSLLKVDPKLLKGNKIKLLLTIHSHSQQISEYNFLVYQGIKKASKVAYDNKTINFISDSTEDHEEIIKFAVEQEFKYANEFIKNAIASKKSHSPYLFNNFLTDFVEIVDKLTLEDILRPVNNTGYDKKKKTIKLSRNKRRDLQMWRPLDSPEDEFNYNQSRRIFHGKLTSFKKFPYIASIHVMGKFACGSSIISKQFVITAASCLQLVYNIQYERGNPNILAIRVGSDYTRRLGELVPIIDVYFHPFYQPDCLRNNLAIARFKMKPSLRRRLNIMRIQYERTEAPENITQVVMVGWGDQHPQVSTLKDQLFSTNIDVFNFKLCMDTYSSQFVNENNFCAGFTNRGGGACQRDVGGPAVVSGILLGVVSFGPPVCGTPNAPTVFTNISYYVQWIDSIVSERPRSSPERTKLITTTKYRSDVIPKAYNALRSKEHQTQEPASKKELPETLRFIKNILRIISIVEPHSLATDVDDVLYGELEDEKKSFWTTTIAPDKLHHPLVNKSISLEPEVSIPPDLPTTTPISIIDEIHLEDILKTANLISTLLPRNIAALPDAQHLPIVRLKKENPKNIVKEVKPSSYVEDSFSSSEMSPNITGEYSDSGYDPFENEIFDVLNRSLQSINITITKKNRTLQFISNTLKTKPKKRTRLQWTYDDKPTSKLNAKLTLFKKTTLDSDYDEESTTRPKTKKATMLDYDEPSTTKRKTKTTLFKIVASHKSDSGEDSKLTAKHTSFTKATKKIKKHNKQGTLKTDTTRSNSKYSFTASLEVPLIGIWTNLPQKKTTNEFDYEDLRPKDKSYGGYTARRSSKPEIRFGMMKEKPAKEVTTLKYDKYETSSEEPSRRSLLDYMILD